MKKGYIIIIRIFLVVFISCILASAISPIVSAEERFDDYWEEEEKSDQGFDLDYDQEEDTQIQGRNNIFFRTDSLIQKVIYFVVLIVAGYLICWLLFSSIIMHNKSPAKTFFILFLGYMLSIYISAFLCFSEYAYYGTYDEGLSSLSNYLSGLNWYLLLTILTVWGIFSIFFSYLMRGKS